MKIRNKILVYFSSTVILLVAVSLSLIYFLFAGYREEEFQQRQKEKAKLTIRLLSEYKAMSENLTGMMDQLSIHDFFDEKMLVFDKDKDLAYASVDDLPIANYSGILNALSPANHWIETREGPYDIIGLYVESNGGAFYAISKAYDEFGFSKLRFLRHILIALFLAISVAVVLVSLFLSRKIARPISDLAERLGAYELSTAPPPAAVATTTYEFRYLNEKFNELLERTNKAFAFQKHTIQHISHELKTPVAILVSELEKLRHYSDIEEMRPVLEGQISKAKSLGGIINVLLEISKIESGQAIQTSPVRVDELLFDIIEELNIVYPHFNFEVNYFPVDVDFNRLTLTVNEMLVRQAFQNLLVNCIAYAEDGRAEIKIDCSLKGKLNVSISNYGTPVTPEEEPYLFGHFFRGSNSRNKSGFGLGLVLTKKIVDFSAGHIAYHSRPGRRNVFEVSFPLS